MAVDVTLTDVASGYNRGAVNDNFTEIETALQDALSRSGSSPNTMSVDIDLNDNDLLNVGTINTSSLKVAGVTVTDATYVPEWKGAWITSTSYVVNDLVNEAGSTYICLIAHTSGVFSTDLTAVKWEIFAQQGSAGAGTGDMLAANNLSDIANVATSRSNLGLGTLAVENTAPIAQGGTGAITASAAFTALKQDATTSTTGVIEKSTSAENIAGTSDVVYPTVAGTKEMINVHGSGGLTLLETVSASDATTHELALTAFNSSIYEHYVIEIPYVGISGVASGPQIEFSADGGSTYLAAGSYEDFWVEFDLGSANTTFGNSPAADYIAMNGTLSVGMESYLRILNMHNASSPTIVSGDSTDFSSIKTTRKLNSSAGNTAVNALKLYFPQTNDYFGQGDQINLYGVNKF